VSWAKINLTPKTPESAVIIRINSDDVSETADILVNGKIISVHIDDLNIPPVKKTKTNFGIKR